jgi:hypothetical protein
MVFWRSPRSYFSSASSKPRGVLAVARARSVVNRPGWRECRTVVAGLRQECPPALSVVRASWLPETISGQYLRRERRFVFQLDRNLAEPQAVEVLCHEWAHGPSWKWPLAK